MFLPRSRRLLGTISTLFLRKGGPWLLRSILAVTCPHGFLQAQDALHLGRYGPDGHSCACRHRQLHGQGWFYYWLRYTSCVFPLGCRQVCDVLHHGQYGPEEHVSSYLPQVQLLDEVVVPVVCNDICPGPAAPHSGGAAVAVPLQGRHHLRWCAEIGSHGLTVQ